MIDCSRPLNLIGKGPGGLLDSRYTLADIEAHANACQGYIHNSIPVTSIQTNTVGTFVVSMLLMFAGAVILVWLAVNSNK